jgi:group II intron reverse transcriptase/maturase
MEPQEGKMTGISSPEDISTKRQRIAKLAKQAPQMGLWSLSHHIDIEWLLEAYRRTRKDGATGVDGQSAQEYATNLRSNLASLLERAKSGTYRAPPVKRVHIPKGDGKELRPIGVPTFEDKVLQRAVVMTLEPIYEQDFLNCSYGFRPGRNPHQALEALREGMMKMGGGWVVELDIRKFFDNIDHRHIQELVRHRVRDGVLLRLIGKWLNAGVMEDGALEYPETGTPQGGVVSPLLANIFLHEVLDKWFEEQVKPCLKGQGFLIRYADDGVLVFEREDDARRVLEALPKRFGKYGLALHPEKTRLVSFGRPPRGGKGDAGSFDFLGFTHYWGKSLKGNWVIKRKTASSRLTRALKRISLWCRANRHEPLKVQQEGLNRKLRGHYQYYGITGNSSALAQFQNEVRRIWHKWLARRSERGCTWERFLQLLALFPLVPARIPRRAHQLALNLGANP